MMPVGLAVDVVQVDDYRHVAQRRLRTDIQVGMVM
jgi:hypothetical protein